MFRDVFSEQKAASIGLHHAVQKKDLIQVKLHLSNKADANTCFDELTYWSGESVLAYAVYYDMTDIVITLLQHGADPDTKFRFIYNQNINGRSEGLSLIEYALYYCYDKTASALVQYRATVIDYNDKEVTIKSSWLYSDWTYLAYAVYYNLKDSTKILLDKGCDPNQIFNRRRQTTLRDYAVSNHLQDILSSFVKVKWKKALAYAVSQTPRQKEIDRLNNLTDGSDFHRVIEGFNSNKTTYIDSTIFIERIIQDAKNPIKIFTRPSGLGASFQLSLLKFFFDRNLDKIMVRNSFRNCKITNVRDTFEHQNAFTIIKINTRFMTHYFSFNYENTYEGLCYNIGSLYNHFLFLLESDKLNQDEKDYFNSVLAGYNKKIDEETLKVSLANLIKYLNKFYNNNKIIILIDGYDRLLRTMFRCDQNDKMKIHCLFTTILNMGFSDRNSFYQAILVGKIPTATSEAQITGAKYYTLPDREFNDCIGYTEENIRQLFPAISNLLLEKIKRNWGYETDKSMLINPEYFKRFIEYWRHNSSMHNDHKMMEQTFNLAFTKINIHKNDFIKRNIICLIKKRTIATTILKPIYVDKIPKTPQEEANLAWNILIAFGFLSPVNTNESDHSNHYTFRVANDLSMKLFKGLYSELDLSNFERNLNLQRQTFLLGTNAKLGKHSMIFRFFRESNTITNGPSQHNGEMLRKIISYV